MTKKSRDNLVAAIRKDDPAALIEAIVAYRTVTRVKLQPALDQILKALLEVAAIPKRTPRR
jgi:hypothetical protein